MCLKVSALRELAEAGDPAVPLTEHQLPRVRANAVRTLGLVGDTEHVDAVAAVLDDEDPLPRRAADLAMRRITARLDLPPPL
jgi:HEAT repeat protein